MTETTTEIDVRKAYTHAFYLITEIRVFNQFETLGESLKKTFKAPLKEPSKEAIQCPDVPSCGGRGQEEAAKLGDGGRRWDLPRDHGHPP